jgi:hypothetical protein
LLHEELEPHEEAEDDSQRQHETVIGWLPALPDEKCGRAAEAKPEQIGDDFDVGREKAYPEHEQHPSK